MDPQATLAAWLDSTDAAERDDLAQAYNSWRSHGGFPATLHGLRVERMHRHLLDVAHPERRP